MNRLTSLNLSVEIPQRSNAGNLTLSHRKLPNNTLDFRTCEGVLEQNRDFGLFKMDLGVDQWKVVDNHLSYQWHYPQGIIVQFKASLNGDFLDLAYTISNATNEILRRVQIHPCIPTTHAPAFSPECDLYAPGHQAQYFDRRGPAMIPCHQTYFDLFRRIHLWHEDQPFCLSNTSTGDSEVHLSVMKTAEEPIEWVWWNNCQETFDIPFLTVSNKTADFTLALAFESSIWASSNVGDDRACFHLFPHFGTMESGQSRTVTGRFYFIEGSKNDAYQRYHSDFLSK